MSTYYRASFLQLHACKFDRFEPRQDLLHRRSEPLFYSNPSTATDLMWILARYSGRAAPNSLILLAITAAIVASSELPLHDSTVGWLVRLWKDDRRDVKPLLSLQGMADAG